VTASSQPAGGTQPNVGGQHDNVTTFGTTTIGNTSGIGTETVNGQTIVGTVQGQSGASGSPGPFFPVLLGPDKSTTSKREACPGWMQTSGLDHCIRPQDQLRPQDVRR
jgi:hypothetical protein